MSRELCSQSLLKCVVFSPLTHCCPRENVASLGFMNSVFTSLLCWSQWEWDHSQKRWRLFSPHVWRLRFSRCASSNHCRMSGHAYSKQTGKLLLMLCSACPVNFIVAIIGNGSVYSWAPNKCGQCLQTMHQSALNSNDCAILWKGVTSFQRWQTSVYWGKLKSLP